MTSGCARTHTGWAASASIALISCFSAVGFDMRSTKDGPWCRSPTSWHRDMLKAVVTVWDHLSVVLGLSQCVRLCYRLSQCVTVCFSVSQCYSVTVSLCHSVSQCVTVWDHLSVVLGLSLSGPTTLTTSLSCLKCSSICQTIAHQICSGLFGNNNLWPLTSCRAQTREKRRWHNFFRRNAKGRNHK